MPTSRDAIIRGPREGEQLGPSSMLKAGRRELGVFAGVIDPGEGNNPHLHREHADAFYVLEGELQVFVGAVSARLRPGGLMVAPPGVSHFFRNPGRRAARHLNLHAPGESFIALARARARGETVDSSEYDVFAPEPGGEGVLSGPGEGERLRSEHGHWLIKAAFPQLNVIEQELSAGAADRRPHCHKRHVESFYVLAGSVEFSIGSKTVHAGEGTSVLIPPGMRHTLKNSGSENARLLNVHAPESGYVDYLRANARGGEFHAAHYDVHHVD